MEKTMIGHTVAGINRTRAPYAVLEATGRQLYVNVAVVAAMPRGEGDEAITYLFKPEAWEYDRNGHMSDEGLERALGRRDLRAEDPYTLAALNTADPALADKRPHGTHWKDSEGWCYLTFDRCWRGERRACVIGDGNTKGWVGEWWFAGRRK